jgi:dTDP-4-amino-4,6-dideoxy-D-galactose acyltransferase
VTDPPCSILTWDSTFFGRTVARVQAERLDGPAWERIAGWCRDNRVEWLYFLATAEDAETTRVAERAGFAFVDARLELGVKLPAASGGPREQDAGWTLRDATPADIPVLEEVAASVHVDSRFFFDARVPRERAQELYRTWIRRSVEGHMADHVLVAEVDGRAGGYVTGRMLADGVGQIGLLGLSEHVRGRGIGPALVTAILHRFGDRGARRVTVVTQARNIGAQRTYQRCGFLTEAIGLWYHKWFV